METCGDIGLEINMAKSEYMNNQNDLSPFRFNDVALPPKKTVKYLGVTIDISGALTAELNRRISSAWFGFNEYRTMFKSPSFPMSMKRKLFNAVVLPRFVYGCESWSLSNSHRDRLRVVQRKMERAMLNVKIQDRLPSATLRGITRLKDVVVEATKLKFSFCSRISQMHPGRWSLVVTEWRPFNRKRGPGRPLVRWRDEMVLAVQSYNRSMRRGRVRPPNVRGEEILRMCRDKNLWKAIKEHHIATI